MEEKLIIGCSENTLSYVRASVVWNDQCGVAVLFWISVFEIVHRLSLSCFLCLEE